MAKKKETIAIVNDRDKIIGEARYSEVHKKGLLHREAWTFLIDGNDILLQQRKKGRKWCASSAGHFSERRPMHKAQEESFLKSSELTFPSRHSARLHTS